MWRVVDGAKEGRRWVRVNVVQRWPSFLPHLTRCSHNPRTPPQWWSHHRFTQAVYSLTLVLCVIIHVWCLCWCVCRCPWHCAALALALSLPPPVFLRHTHAGDLIHRVYDHLASPRHRGCVAMNTMRVGVTIPTGWPPCSFGSAGRTSSFHDERVGGRRRGGVDIYAYI